MVAEVFWVFQLIIEILKQCENKKFFLFLMMTSILISLEIFLMLEMLFVIIQKFLSHILIIFFHTLPSSWTLKTCHNLQWVPFGENILSKILTKIINISQIFETDGKDRIICSTWVTIIFWRNKFPQNLSVHSCFSALKTLSSNHLNLSHFELWHQMPISWILMPTASWNNNNNNK